MGGDGELQHVVLRPLTFRFLRAVLHTPTHSASLQETPSDAPDMEFTLSYA